MSMNLNYEDAIKELNKITNKLENEQLSLNESEKLFDRAVELAKFCQEELSKTSKKLFIIKKEFDRIVEEEVE